MTTLPDRPRSALLVTDVQKGVVAHAHRRDEVIAHIAALVERAREQHAPVVWVQHSDDHIEQGTESWEYVPELVRREDEPLVPKHYADAFENTGLEAVLAGHRVGRLVVAGAQTDECIRATLHGAFTRGYDVTLVADAHTTQDLTAYGAPPPAQVIAHTNLYWQGHRGSGRRAGTADTADVTFTPASGEG
ncbi:isochorismatase family protein [Streptomyces echinoruber]|uniref:Isochorismatase n=1 Tax=Streptomyces echinoruber TaxID=68898 RepID=A0A918R7J4_9ACTN|nr:isochorismatase family protein [Streptomyces echinoruber]GGZ88065.1 isochorismatase [Streptomyces echinoruber]